MRRFSFPALTMRGRAFEGLRGWTGKPLHPSPADIPVRCIPEDKAPQRADGAEPVDLIGSGDRGAAQARR